MPERDSYPAGAFCWVELLTPDAEGAKAFYGELFGWDFYDHRDGDYTTMLHRGKHVAGLHQPPPERGIPPSWNSYVAVEDADAAAERATGLGATVVAGPFDVGDSLRLASIQDPQGAVVSVFQAGEHNGAELVNEPGALTMNQLNTPDPGAAAGFYSGLFGWEAEQVSDEPGSEYWSLLNGGRLNGGLMPLPEGAGAPPHWLAYFGVEDLAGAAARIAELGGAVMVGPVEVPQGNFIVAQDPQGAVVALWEGNYDD